MHFTKLKSIATIFIFMGIMLGGLSVFSQTEEPPEKYTDDELRKFASVIIDVITIQQQGQMQMISLIQDHDMSIQRFNEMMIDSQDKSLEEMEGTEDEKVAFADISVRILGIQEEMEDQLIAAIQEEGLSIERYEEILMDYQQDPELQQRIQRLVEE